jgi:uncharacterized membrane protein
VRAPALAVLAALPLAALACARALPQHPPVAERDGEVRLPLAAVDDGGVHFYTFRPGAEGQVNLFVRRDGEGRLHASLDACYGCFQYRLGYRREGDAVVCNACLLAFPLREAAWDYIGPCAPIPLPHRVEGGDFVVDVRRLEKAARYFAAP